MKDRELVPDDRSADTKMAAEGGGVEQADELADRAKRVGAAGPNGADSMRMLRDSAIIARAGCGVSATEIAAEFGISPRTVRRVVKQAARVRSPLEQRPMELVENALRLYSRMHADAELLAFRYCEWSPHATIAAKRLALEALDRYRILLTDLGKFPVHLNLFRNEAEMNRVADLMVGKLQALARGEASAEDCIEFFRRLLEPDTPLYEPDQ